MYRNILVVAATPHEIAFLVRNRRKPVPGKVLRVMQNPVQVDLLVTGTGIHQTVYHLTKTLSEKKYDLAINLGICGSHDRTLGPVRLVHIVADTFADFGAEDGTKFLTAADLKWKEVSARPFRSGWIEPAFRGKFACLNMLPEARGITVNTCTGSEPTARERRKRFGPVMESMEGAAFFFVCRSEKTVCFQVRAVSNHAGRRNKKAWKTPEAIAALEGFAALLMMELSAANSRSKSSRK